MTKVKKSVFVSSTYSDLKEYRTLAWEMLKNELGLEVKGMEEFGARKTAPLQTCLEEVTQSDIYIGLIGYRFGSLDSGTGKSFTQLEYERANELGKELLIYFLDPDTASVFGKNIDKGELQVKLDSFKSVLKDRHTIDLVSGPTDFSEKLCSRLKNILKIGNEGKQKVIADDEQNINTLRKFNLIPASVSGKEAFIKFGIKGDPYSLSKEICDAFGLKFGASIGCDIVVVSPEFLESQNIEILLVESKLVDEFLNLQQEDIISSRVVLGFHDGNIKYIRTIFKPTYNIEEYPNPNYDSSRPSIDDYLITSNIVGANNPKMITKQEYIPSSGFLAYILKEII